MPPIQTALAIVGISKQAAKGTPDAQPDFVFGVTDGAPFKVEIDQEPEERTLDASRNSPDANRLTVVPGQEFSTRVFPASAGLLLYGALGAISTSGAGNFTHTITPASDLPYLTAWGKFGGEIKRVQDAKIDELTLDWEEAGPLTLEASLLGTIPGFPGSITPVVDDSLSNYFRAAGGTFKTEMAGATPLTAPVKAGNVKIANGTEPVILSASVVPDDVSVAHQEIMIGATLVVPNLDDWRKFVTGTAGGSTVSQVAVMGSVEFTFVIDANTQLKITALRVPFTGDFPEADPGGGPAELELEGPAILTAAGGAAITAELKNQTASY